MAKVVLSIAGWEFIKRLNRGFKAWLDQGADAHDLPEIRGLL